MNEKIYRIQDLADRFNLTTRSLRFWEEKGLIEPVFRTAGHRRVYDESVVKAIEQILRLKEQGLSLDDIQEQILKLKKRKKTKKNPIRIVIDSTSAISAELQESAEIDVIPLYVHMGKKKFLDGLNITEEDFYERLQNREGDVEISTSEPTEEDFYQLYGRLIAEGAEVIYSLHLSELFSKTVVNARAAAQKFRDVQINVFDSQTSGQSLMLFALKLRDALSNGMSSRDCAKYLRQLIQDQWLVVTVSSLQTLSNLGLISVDARQGFQGLLGELMNFRPVMELSGKSAGFSLISRADTMEQALKTMESRLQKHLKTSNLELQMLGVSHSRLAPESEAIQKDLAEQYKVPVIRQKGSVVLCSHLGPGSLGISAIFERR